MSGGLELAVTVTELFSKCLSILWLSVWRQPDGDRDRLRTGNQGSGNRDWGENIDFLTIFGTKIAIFGRS